MKLMIQLLMSVYEFLVKNAMPQSLAYHPDWPNGCGLWGTFDVSFPDLVVGISFLLQGSLAYSFTVRKL